MPSEACTGEDLSVPVRRRPIAQILAAVFSLAIAAFSIYILGRTISGVSLGALSQAIAATSAEQIAAAALLAVISYLALTGYDGLALRQLHLRVPYKTTALASFTSYAISFTLGFPLITAGTVRYWIYSQVGLVKTDRGVHRCDALVINADFARAMSRLVPDHLRRRWTDKKLAGKKYSCSTFMLYLGIEGRYDEIDHHTIYTAKDYVGNLADIETRHVLSDDTSFYVQNPCITDSTLRRAVAARFTCWRR